MNEDFGIFGASLDPANSPERLDVKLAYVSHLQRTGALSPQNYDPYDVMQADLRPQFPRESAWVGKMPVDSWLTPRPRVSDLPRLTAQQFASFLENDGCWDYALKAAEFVESRVFPRTPVMIGVDHSLTGGVLLALAREYDNLNVIILDAHFDVMKFSKSAFDGAEEKSPFYHCGDFLSYVLERGVIHPENLWIMGVGENVFAEDDCRRMDDLSRQNAGEAKKWINKGVHVLFKEDIISDGINIKLNGPTYVSIDMDIGSLSSIFAARFMTCYGLLFEEFRSLLSSVSRSIRESGVPLVGLDIMEIDIHLLEVTGTALFQDYTRRIAGEALGLFLK